MMDRIFIFVVALVGFPVFCVICTVAFNCGDESLYRLEDEQVTQKEQRTKASVLLKPLQIVDWMDIVDEECPICFCVFDEQDPVVETGCRHRFHENCLLSWFMQNANCPVCRESCA